MPLILAIEPDRRQAAHLTAVVRNRVEAELILVSTTAKALDAIGNRVPDLVLVPALLSPQDDAALAQALRVIATAANVQMLTIPVLGPPKEEKSGGVLSALRRKKSTEPEGCDPDVFADQIVSYLEHLALERSYTNVDDDATEGTEPVVIEPPAPVTEEFAIEFDPAAEFQPVSLEAAEIAEPPQSAVFEPPQTSHFEAPPPSQVQADAPEPAFSAATDESVSFALEEAVRGLFADQQPEAFADTPSHTPAGESTARSEPETPAIVEEVASAIDPVAIEEPAVVEEIPDVVPQIVPEPQSPSNVEELFEPIELEPRSSSVTELLNDPDRADANQLVAALATLPLALIEIPEQRDAAPARGRHADRLGEDAPVPTKHSQAPARQHTEKPTDPPPAPRPVASVPTAPAPALSAASPTHVATTRTARHQPASPEPAAPVPAPAAATKPVRHQAAEPEPVTPAVAAAPSPEAHEHHAGKSEKEWVALIESLRVDVERIRAEHDKPAAKLPKSSGKAAAKAAAAKPAAAAAAKAVKSKKPKPVQDEWGFFDPEQCGFAALLAKLEEVTDEEGTPV